MTGILLVDDNKYVLEALALIFDDYARGHEILKAGNGLEALDILDERPVALILTDIEMPVMNGFQFIEHKNRLHPSTPLVAMTSDLSPAVRSRLRSLGVLRCLEKPFDYEEVTSLITENLAACPVLISGGKNATHCVSRTM